MSICYQPCSPRAELLVAPSISMFHSKRPPSMLRSEKSTEKAELIVEGAAKSEDVAGVGGDEGEEAEDEDDDDLIIVASSEEEGDGE